MSTIKIGGTAIPKDQVGQVSLEDRLNNIPAHKALKITKQLCVALKTNRHRYLCVMNVNSKKELCFQTMNGVELFFKRICPFISPLYLEDSQLTITILCQKIVTQDTTQFSQTVSIENHLFQDTTVRQNHPSALVLIDHQRKNQFYCQLNSFLTNYTYIPIIVLSEDGQITNLPSNWLESCEKIGNGSSGVVYQGSFDQQTIVAIKQIYSPLKSCIKMVEDFDIRKTDRYKIDRTVQESISAFLDQNMKCAIVQTHFIVDEYSSGNVENTWVIPHKNIKQWISDQYVANQGKMDIRIAGYIFPLAEGQQLHNIQFSNIQPHERISCLISISHTLLNMLQELSRHRYVHGDLKEANIFYHNEQVKVIDWGNSQKISKDETNIVNTCVSRCNGGFTHDYTHPNVKTNNGYYLNEQNDHIVGFEQDIFSVGVILLNLYYQVSSDMDNQYYFSQQIKQINIQDQNYEEKLADIQKLVQSLPIAEDQRLDSVRQLGIELINNALDCKKPRTNSDDESKIRQKIIQDFCANQH